MEVKTEHFADQVAEAIAAKLNGIPKEWVKTEELCQYLDISPRGYEELCKRIDCPPKHYIGRLVRHHLPTWRKYMMKSLSPS